MAGLCWPESQAATELRPKTSGTDFSKHGLSRFENLPVHRLVPPAPSEQVVVFHSKRHSASLRSKIVQLMPCCQTVNQLEASSWGLSLMRWVSRMGRCAHYRHTWRKCVGLESRGGVASLLRVLPLVLATQVLLGACEPISAQPAEGFQVWVTKDKAYAFGCQLGSTAVTPPSGWMRAEKSASGLLETQCRSIVAARTGGACRYVPDETIKLCSTVQEEKRPVLRPVLQIQDAQEVVEPGAQPRWDRVLVPRLDPKLLFKDFQSATVVGTASGGVQRPMIESHRALLLQPLVKVAVGAPIAACAFPKLQPPAAMRFLAGFSGADESTAECSSVLVEKGAKLLTAAHCAFEKDIYAGNTKLDCFIPQKFGASKCWKPADGSARDRTDCNWDIAVCEVPKASVGSYLLGNVGEDIAHEHDGAGANVSVWVAGFGESYQANGEATRGKFCAGNAVLKLDARCATADRRSYATADKNDPKGGIALSGDSGGAVFLQPSSDEGRKLLGITVHTDGWDTSYFLDLRTPEVASLLNEKKIPVNGSICPK